MAEQQQAAAAAPVADIVVGLYPHVTHQLTMVPAALFMSTMLGPDPDPLESLPEVAAAARSSNFLTRSVKLEWLVRPEVWATQLLGSQITVAWNKVAEVGRSSLTNEKLLVARRVGGDSAAPDLPILKVFFTLTHVNAEGTKSTPMPSDAVAALKAAGGADAPTDREPWLSAPAGSFEWPTVARYTEMDGNQHVNQSHCEPLPIPH